MDIKGTLKWVRDGSVLCYPEIKDSPRAVDGNHRGLTALMLKRWHKPIRQICPSESIRKLDNVGGLLLCVMLGASYTAFSGMVACIRAVCIELQHPMTCAGIQHQLTH